MLNRRFLWMMGLLAALTVSGSLYAQEERNWVLLGAAHVDKRADHDRIKVHRSQESFRAIRLQIDGGNVEIDRIVVHFRDGITSDRLMHVRLASGSTSRAIDLPGRRRIIKSVELWYRKDSSSTRPTVSLFGLR